MGQHKQETQLHNQEISGLPRQKDLFHLVDPVGDLNRDLGWGFLALAWEGENTTLTQVWDEDELTVLEMNIN